MANFEWIWVDYDDLIKSGWNFHPMNYSSFLAQLIFFFSILDEEVWILENITQSFGGANTFNSFTSEIEDFYRPHYFDSLLQLKKLPLNEWPTFTQLYCLIKAARGIKKKLNFFLLRNFQFG